MIDQLTNVVVETTGLSNALNTAIPSIMQTITTIVTAAAVIASRLPPADGNGFGAKVHKAINMLAFNFGQASNKNGSN